jgi:hypothetical protein
LPALQLSCAHDRCKSGGVQIAKEVKDKKESLEELMVITLAMVGAVVKLLIAKRHHHRSRVHSAAPNGRTFWLF